MSKAKSSISQAKSYQEMGEFWDTHDLTEFWDQTEPADFEVDIQSEVAIHSEMMQVEVLDVHFNKDMLFVELSDERQIGLPFKKVKWLDWLAKATPEQRANWSIEPNGFAIYWEDLDDGIEICHLLGMQPLL